MTEQAFLGVALSLQDRILCLGLSSLLMRTEEVPRGHVAFL